MIDYGLAGRAALVTGGGSGIGESIARLLASSGAAVAVLDISAVEAERMAAAIRVGGGRAATFECDVSDETRVNAVERRSSASGGG
jgi:3-oxoacyl-[acyl-carrier protein] reductase